MTVAVVVVTVPSFHRLLSVIIQMRPSTQMNRREVQDAIFFANGMKRSRVNSVSGGGGGFQFNRTIISESCR
ncbi:hypothetical protein L1987_00281 [Smallanthus sonchifolius]|uniref:Uncharacterized protein n=1 Tax=Smallanthus sonchifolius TaxID=185202 RepID=A0ACB9K1T4_9ASTR|nr:hypothetical protein L1987_00281 [Smallanthus sonchifolius]